MYGLGKCDKKNPVLNLVSSPVTVKINVPLISGLCNSMKVPQKMPLFLYYIRRKSLTERNGGAILFNAKPSKIVGIENADGGKMP